MIHPDTELRKVSEEIGYGVFATALIPKGTIVYVRDMLEIALEPGRYEELDRQYKDIVDRFSYIDETGSRIVSWDIGKYVNHSCDCNTISTGFGFEIAVRDIQPGEEMTDEYGIFNLPVDMPCYCGSPSCRGRVSGGDWHTYAPRWDKLGKEAVRRFSKVPQPLVKYLTPETYTSLMRYLHRQEPYHSILRLQYQGEGLAVETAAML